MANTFALILTLATIITGVFWGIERFKLKPARKAKLKRLQEMTQGTEDQQELAKSINKPSWAETLGSLFPVLIIVLVLRSFVYEPFQIPSRSMMPTLLVGDFILVEKFAYGLKDPITQTTLINTGKPKRGDIAVFKYPRDPSTDFIKRVIGLPGDKIVYDMMSKKLHIYPNCDKAICNEEISVTYGTAYPSEWTLLLQNVPGGQRINGMKSIPIEEPISTATQLREEERVETIDKVSHRIMTIPGDMTMPEFIQPGLPVGTWIVPEGHYFMMGDNRDGSSDSRFWGFVPEKNLVGKATTIWMSFEKVENEWPTGVRFSRIGGIK